MYLNHRIWPCILLVCISISAAIAQRLTGEIRLILKDSSGAAVEASGVLVSVSAGIRRHYRTDNQGVHTFRGLPFGPYHLRVEKAGLATSGIAIEVTSEVPVEREVTLGVAPVETTVTVQEDRTMVDSRSPTAARHLGPDTLDYRPSAAPGRSVLELVNAQPGWLLEANGVLHPRGAEYDVQYVIDGMPLYDNRSPAYAQSLGIDEFESMTIRTAGYPAEFGRKLGGVIELTTARDMAPGWHGRMTLQSGSFSQASGFASLQYARGKNSVGMSGEGMMTDRYLDSPVRENYSNHGSGGGVSARFDRVWSSSDSTRFYVNNRHTGFQVPNELLQQSAGQRQDRNADETMGHVSHTHLFSSRLIGQARLMVRDTSARLWSNALSTPILPSQERGFREAYTGGSVSYHRGAHEWKAGGEALFTSIQEDFRYRITAYRLNPGNVRIFDGDVPREFHFNQSRAGRDQAAFIQDLWRRGSLTLSAGLRFDHYRLVEDETALGPRLGAAYAFPSAGLVLRASYDRVFQVPAIENILLSSTNLISSLGGEGAFLPLKPSRGNFVEAGFTKSIWNQLRLDGTWYRRSVNNFADDSLLLNTGVGFPIAFREAVIRGVEAKLEVPQWGPFSGFVSYSNMLAIGYLPVAGGLLLGDDADLQAEGSFPITQDQRNTFRSRVRVQPHRRVWFAMGGAYNSGLPFEIEGPANRTFINAQYGPAIISKVNYDRGRVRPSVSLSTSIGIELLRTDRTRMKLQADVFNIGDRLNLINFSGVLSGTAIEAGRNFAIRLNASF
ncbi:MAG TPA: TonB-dependent receptor [Bryobacteraceae bacterium]|nr:TonB-dependent receptor [Bryobacteraceae bacterium]